MKINAQRRKVGRARQTIVHQRSCDQLAVIVIGNPFQQDLPDSLRYPAMNLTMHDKRIDYGSDVVNGAIGNDVYLSSLRIDLDFADVTAIRVMKTRSSEFAGRVERRGNIRRQIAQRLRPHGEVEQADGNIGSLHVKRAVTEFEIGLANFKNVRRQRLALLDHRVACDRDRRPRHDHRSRTDTRQTFRQVGTVAFLYAHLVEWDAEALRNELRKACLVPLA